MKTKKVVRFVYASNRSYDSGKNELSPRQGDFYILDLLTGAPAEADPEKGWYRKVKTAQAAADKLNAKDTSGPYVELTNGYVAVSHGWSAEGGHRIGCPRCDDKGPLSGTPLVTA